MHGKAGQVRGKESERNVILFSRAYQFNAR